MKAKNYFNVKKVAQEAFDAFKDETKSRTLEDKDCLCTCEIEPKDYGVYVRVWEAETGLDCEDAFEFEAEVEELYLELLAKSEREEKEEQLHNETLNYTSNFI